MNQSEAEALGWKFFETSTSRKEIVDVDVFSAARHFDGSNVEYVFEDKDQLLGAVASWEASRAGS